MDTEQLVDAIPAINDFSTVASIACVLPTYFLRLEPATYRYILSLGMIFGLATWAAAMTTIFWPNPHQFVVLPVVFFSPLAVVLIAILARIRRVTRVGVWSTVVLACVIVDWVGISWLILALS